MVQYSVTLNRKTHMKRLQKVVSDTKDVFRTKWSATELSLSAWVINAIIWITAIRSLSYGFELLLVSNNPISPLMAFANILGIQTWGILMLLSLLILVVGVLAKRSIVVTIGALLCAAVWTAFGLCLGIGYFHVGTGMRFAIAALATAATWTTLFLIQIRTLKRNGAGND